MLHVFRTRLGVGARGLDKKGASTFNTNLEIYKGRVYWLGQHKCSICLIGIFLIIKLKVAILIVFNSFLGDLLA